MVGEQCYGHRHARDEYIPDPEPKVIHSRRRRPKGPVHPPMSLGYDDMEAINSIFGGGLQRKQPEGRSSRIALASFR
jgi:hypothetical protein